MLYRRVHLVTFNKKPWDTFRSIKGPSDVAFFCFLSVMPYFSDITSSVVYSFLGETSPRVPPQSVIIKKKKSSTADWEGGRKCFEQKRTNIARVGGLFCFISGPVLNFKRRSRGEIFGLIFSVRPRSKEGPRRAYEPAICGQTEMRAPKYVCSKSGDLAGYWSVVMHSRRNLAAIERTTSNSVPFSFSL